MADMLAIAVAGAGSIGRTHVALIERSAECRLAAIADPAPGAAEWVASNDVPAYRDLSALISAERPDGIILATPNVLHVEQALACIAAGIPCLIEKPVAHAIVDGERLLQAIEASSVPALVGHHRLHSPIMAEAIRVIADGTLGPLVAITGSALFRKPDSYFEEAPWRREPGGGPILINLIHEIANLRALAGEIAEVQASVAHKSRGHEVEDTAAMTFRFESGALGTFILSDAAASTQSWEQTSGENPAYPRDESENCYEIAGTRGSLSVPTMVLRTFPPSMPASWFTPMQSRVVAVERVDPLARQLSHFCAVIRGDAKPLVSIRDGLQNLRVVEAIMQAARNGASVKVAH